MGESEATEKRSARVTLTAAQMATPEGAALRDLCKRVTEDGEVSDAEVDEIREWLGKDGGGGVVGTAFLGKTLERVLADGKLLPYERRELQEALERILPKKDRDVAIQARTAAELRRYKEAPETATVVRGILFDFMVAGTGYEGRGPVIEQYVRVGDDAILSRDRGNKFSRNAVAVKVSNGRQIGFVPEEDAEEMAPLLDAGHEGRAYFKKVLDGRRGPIPVVVVLLTPPVEGVPLRGATTEPAAPEVSAKEPGSTGQPAPNASSAVLLMAVFFGVVFAVAYMFMK